MEVKINKKNKKYIDEIAQKNNTPPGLVVNTLIDLGYHARQEALKNGDFIDIYPKKEIEEVEE